VMTNKIILGDCLNALPTIPDKSVQLIYVDPPFGTGKTQKMNRIKTTASEDGDRIGFGGKRYSTEKLDSVGSYEDSFDDFEAFLMPRIKASLHCLADDGSIFVHLDQREVHYVKVAMDKLLGRNRYVQQLIWSFDFGARSKTKWPAKHNVILWYAMNPKKYVFNYDAMDRLPYLAPGLCGKEKAARGKTPTDTWFITVCPTNGSERTGYPSQKPRKLLERIVKVHGNIGDTVLDFFAGSGTTGEAAALHGRQFVMVDSNPEAIEVMKKRLQPFNPEYIDLSVQ